jgi:hypothetical protein
MDSFYSGKNRPREKIIPFQHEKEGKEKLSLQNMTRGKGGKGKRGK